MSGASRTATTDVARFAHHTPFTDPGPHRDLLASAPADPLELADVVPHLLVHYVAGQVPPAQWDSIDDRWTSAVLDRLAPAGTIAAPLPREACTIGCCRDFSLLYVAALREHGVPARTRVGFAPYIPTGDTVCDHVVAEYWDERAGHWARLDPQMVIGTFPGVDVRDLGTGDESPFRTAAQVWTDHRAGRVDVDRYGVPAGDAELRGEWIVGNYVLGELAHLTGHELLLWDLWGAMDLGPLTVGVPLEAARRYAPHLVAGRSEADRELLDEVAVLLLDADEHLDELTVLAQDPRLGPGAGVLCLSPSGRGGPVQLDRAPTGASAQDAVGPAGA